MCICVVYIWSTFVLRIYLVQDESVRTRASVLPVLEAVLRVVVAALGAMSPPSHAHSADSTDAVHTNVGKRLLYVTLLMRQKMLMGMQRQSWSDCSSDDDNTPFFTCYNAIRDLLRTHCAHLGWFNKEGTKWPSQMLVRSSLCPPSRLTWDSLEPQARVARRRFSRQSHCKWFDLLQRGREYSRKCSQWQPRVYVGLTCDTSPMWERVAGLPAHCRLVSLAGQPSAFHSGRGSNVFPHCGNANQVKRKANDFVRPQVHWEELQFLKIQASLVAL